METSIRLVCPIHGMPDCSPLLNGCSLVIRTINHALGEPWDQPTEPKQLLAAVTDGRGLRYFRWAYDTHTFTPWQVVGAVHVMGDQGDEPDLRRWADLPPVAVLSEGIPV